MAFLKVYRALQQEELDSVALLMVVSVILLVAPLMAPLMVVSVILLVAPLMAPLMVVSVALLMVVSMVDQVLIPQVQ